MAPLPMTSGLFPVKMKLSITFRKLSEVNFLGNLGGPLLTKIDNLEHL